MTPEEEVLHLRAENQALKEQLAQRDDLIAQLLQRVQALEEQLSKDSHNSSLPPSSDRFARQKRSRSLRKSSNKLAGGQQGHPGTTLEMSQHPDEVIVLPAVTQCQHCHADLDGVTATSRERRQVVDIPRPRLQKIECATMVIMCDDRPRDAPKPFDVVGVRIIGRGIHYRRGL